MDNNYKIYFGAADSSFLTFDGNNIENINFENSVDIIGDEMSSDILEFNVFFDDADGTLRSVKYGTPVYLYDGDTMIGKYFFEKVERTALKRYKVYTTSMVGLIGREQYYGKFFTQTRFEDAINDILFSSGLSTTLYSVYKPLGAAYSSGNNRYGCRGVKLTSEPKSTETYKQRLQTAFTINDANLLSSGLYNEDRILGYYPNYTVRVRGQRASVSSATYYIVNVYYGSSTPIMSLGGSTPLIGAGSHVTIDVDPVGGLATMDIDYIAYDDPTTTGTLHATADISVSSSTTEISLDTGFGPTKSDGGPTTYTINVIWDYYRIYNADKTPRVDAGFATDGNSNYYVYNKVNGIYGQPLLFAVSGNPIGVIGDLSRGGRDYELSSSIDYGFGVADSTVNGWLPISTRREALHQLLFSQNVSLIKSAEGKMLFTGITDGTSTHIEDEDIFDDNREEIIPEARKIIVTEHAYTVPSGSAQIIFDNTDSQAITGDYLAVFNNAPIYGTPSGSGITIKKYNCNCALVSGRGTISGTPYISAKREAQYLNEEAYDGADVSISNITLITGLNSDNIMNKLKAYYTAGLKKIMTSIIYRNQRCGVKYSFKTLFANDNVGHLSKVSSRASSFIKSNCEFISGYVPPPSGGYGNYQIVDYNGEWTVPSEVREQQYPNIRLILIGKGQDGTAGGSGGGGSSASGSNAGNGGTGGTAGVGGEGGRVYQITLDVTNVAKIAVTQNGYHTVAKTYNDNDTLLNTYTSSSGNPVDVGITNVFTGDIYARRGKDGYKGGNGGKGGCYTSSGGSQVLSDATKGENVSVDYRLQPYNGGSTSPMVARFKDGNGSNPPENYYSFFGGGGGASAGHNGLAATIVSDIYPKITTKGGHGANGVTRTDVYTGYGSGGFGGNGGGGGGGAGVYEKSVMTLPPSYTYEAQQAGEGGTGSSGTPGIAGCLLIYY